MTDPYAEIVGLNVEFGSRRSIPFGGREPVRAVIDTDLVVGRGEAVGLVGESGCGKSTLAGTLVGLVAPTAGAVTVNGVKVPAPKKAERRRLHRSVQMVFQDPYASLHPRLKVWRNVAEAWRANPNLVERRNWRIEAEDRLSAVGIPKDLAARYPRQLSGGQRQRVAIARALAVDPGMLICDEPTSALDVSVQAQILNLLKDIADSRNLTLLFISHDLAVVRQIADRVAVMYAGRIVEEGPVDEVYSNPAHPYTSLLLQASRSLSSSAEPQAEPVRMSDVARAPGCPFRPRCIYAQEQCEGVIPRLELKSSGTKAACYFPVG